MGTMRKIRYIPAGFCRRSVRWSLLLAVGSMAAASVLAQIPDVTVSQRPEPQTPTESAPTMFPHLPESRLWVSGQMNAIFQGNGSFPARYSGANSFQNKANEANGRVITLYTGWQITHSFEVLADAEEAEGLGLSSAVGIAGFPNLDAVRDPTLGASPYLARIMVHTSLPFGHDEADAGPLSTFSEMAKRRFEVRAGKFAIPDFFDTNSVGGDSHLQFLNWSVDQNGAFDFTADARGYTWGLMGEYQNPAWGLRSALALMPGPKNGGPLVWNLRQANTSETEFELHRGPVGKTGIVRLLGWVNHGNMGVYQYAIDQYLAGKTTAPDIDNHPRHVTAKYGFGVNVEQGLSASMTAYGRFGWNSGKTETWSFTEIDQTWAGGVTFLGHLWRRSNDRGGVAFASNGISSVHARYLALGGLGSVLGDGALNYGRENLVEGFYTVHLWRGVFTAADLQYIVSPGYNRDRGPILVPSSRIHVEF